MCDFSSDQKTKPRPFKVVSGLSICLLAILPINISSAAFEASPTGEIALDGAKNGGVAWGDFNNDACLDALVTAGNVQLFQQNKVEGSCSGTFDAVRTFGSPNIDLRSVVWGDYDNDGFIDFAVNKFNQLVIYKNVDGSAVSFVEVLNEDPGNVEGMGWIDADGDGDLELLVQNQGVGTYLYTNDNGVFTSSKIHSANTAGDYLAVADFDVDGDVDAYIRRDGTADNDAQADLYINEGNGTFSVNNTVNENAPNNNKGGVVFCDFDNDGDFDLARTDGGEQGIFEQINGEFSLKEIIPGSHEGIACEDVNNDGRVDIFLSGTVNTLLINSGNFVFTQNNLNIAAGGGQGKGVAFADYDRDGDMDLLLNKNNAPTELWRNVQNDKNYLQVQLTTNNRDVLGATVRLYDADTNEAASGVREINGGMGWGSQGAPFAHFGGIDPEKTYIARVKFVGGHTADHIVVPAQLCDYQLLSIDRDDSNNLRECIADSDGDGLKDDVDIDDDNDGITDEIEGDGAVDTDGDGVPDSRDLDTDNDGLFDFTESGADLSLDMDGDGRIDGAVGGNGLPDSVETASESGKANYNGGQPVDTDGDNIADFRDLDSDDDGINDVTEAGGTDPDGDGIIGDGNVAVNKDGLAPGAGLEFNDDVLIPVPEIIVDTDGDGIKDDDDLDDDNDGITDAIEGDGAVDTDKDGIPDSRDLDSDNDGLYDALESGADVALVDGRVDGAVGENGLPDAVETAVDSGILAYNGGEPVDTDEDGVADFRDLDSDNDGITDVIEGGGPDLNADGILDDGAATVNEDGLVPGAGLTPADSDQDNTPDYRDLDSDNDGLSDIIEIALIDSNGDGMIDSFNTDGNGFDNNSIMPLLAELPDSDADGIPDFRDNDDADNDGVSDFLDMDDDNDGIPDVLEGDGAVDTDKDGIPDSLDLDSDNDGLYDALESGANVTLIDGRVEGAVGSNGLPDAVESGVDSGAIVYALLDTDDDGIHDFRDLDSDNDGITDVIEAGAKDPDNNAFIGSGLPPIVNPDGLASGAGVTPLNTDGDNVADYRDLDSDNDGIPDVREAGGSDDNADLVLRDFIDLNNDGLDDLIAQNPLPVPDTDGDTLPDYRDLDSENDGIPDVREGGAVDRDLDANDGRIYQFRDENGDGLDDGVASLPLTVPDTDGDGIMDYLDKDSDGDGLNDLIEGGGIADVDNNGIVDDFTDVIRDGYDDRIANNPLPLPDTDDDGIHDFRDAKARVVNPPPVVVDFSELETGLKGIGGAGAMGPTLPLLFIASLLCLVTRRKSEAALSLYKKNGKEKV